MKTNKNSMGVRRKREDTHGSGGVTAAIKSSMSTLPLATGVNSGNPSMDGEKREENGEKCKRKGRRRHR